MKKLTTSLIVIVFITLLSLLLPGNSAHCRSLTRSHHFVASSINVPSEHQLLNDETEALFEPGPLMNNARTGHNYATLPDGRVALFGGHGNNFVALDTIEIWSPETNEFTTMQMNFTHSWSGFTLLNDGNYLLTGGCTDWGIPQYATSEIFNPDNNTFTAVNDMVRFRSGTGSTAMNDGRVLIAGAWWIHNNAHTYGELYNPATQSFSEIGPFNVARALTIVMPTNSGGAVVIGGCTPTGERHSMPVEYFNADDGSISILQESLNLNDKDWYVDNLRSQPTFIQKMPNGDYLWLASNLEDEVTSYLLITFNRETKEIEPFITEPALPNSQETHFNFHPLIDTSRNRAYLVGIIPVRETKSTIVLFSINLANGTLTRSENTYELDYYLSHSGIVLLQDGRIMLSGGSQDGSNFHLVSNTLFITPHETETSVEIVNPLPYTKLRNNYPNPFNPETTISFILGEPRDVNIEIFNILGQRILTLVDEQYDAGEHKKVWNGKNEMNEPVSSGIYYYRMKTIDYTMTKKMILLK